MATDTSKITGAADELSAGLAKGGTAAKTLGAEIANAIKALDSRVTALESAEPVPVPPNPNPEPPPSGEFDIPLSYNDPMFTNMTTVPNLNPKPSVDLRKGDVKSHLTITGNDGCIVFCDSGGTSQLSYCRITSDVGCDADILVRKSNGANHLIVDHCFLDNNRPTNPSGTHVDGVQLQDLPNSGTPPSTFEFNHSMLVFGGTNVTAGIFCADYWYGTINITNSVFQAWVGPGVRIHSDKSGDVHLNFKNVFFDPRGSGGGGYMRNEGGKLIIIDSWDNVRYCTVNNGVLTLGAAIAKPTPAQLAAGFGF